MKGHREVSRCPHTLDTPDHFRSVVFVLVVVFPMMPVVVPTRPIGIAVRVNDNRRRWSIVDDWRRGVNHCRRRRWKWCVDHSGLLHHNGLSDDRVGTMPPKIWLNTANAPSANAASVEE